MIEIAIPGTDALRLEHLVLDYNGTLATDGRLLPGVVDRLRHLAGHLEIHVVTAGTFGTVSDELRALPCAITVLPGGAEDVAKQEHVTRLGSDACAAIGNGANDCLMLVEAALGIAVVGDEGASTQALSAADIVCTSILAALDLLAHPKRVTATLRR
jgi:soluble P-type ATPase